MIAPEKRYRSLRTAVWITLVIGLLYAIFVTVRSVVSGPADPMPLALDFGLSFVICAAPIFVIAWPGVALFLRATQPPQDR